MKTICVVASIMFSAAAVHAADPAAATPSAGYESAFSDYRPFQEQRVAPWQLALEGTATGHAGHAGHAAMGGTAEASTTEIPATGVIRKIDKNTGNLTIAHDPVEALGWPKMTMLFRLKDPALMQQIKEGDKVKFFFQKSNDDYVISRFAKMEENPGK